MSNKKLRNIVENWSRIPNYLTGEKFKSFTHKADVGPYQVQTNFFSKNEGNKNPKAKKKYDVDFWVNTKENQNELTFRKRGEVPPKHAMAILSHVRNKVKQFHRHMKPHELTFSVDKSDADYKMKRKVWGKFRRNLNKRGQST